MPLGTAVWLALRPFQSSVFRPAVPSCRGSTATSRPARLSTLTCRRAGAERVTETAAPPARVAAATALTDSAAPAAGVSLLAAAPIVTGGASSHMLASSPSLTRTRTCQSSVRFVSEPAMVAVFQAQEDQLAPPSRLRRQLYS